MDNKNQLGRANSHVLPKPKNMFANLGKVISNPSNEQLPKPSQNMKNWLGSKPIDNSQNPHNQYNNLNPQNVKPASLSHNITPDEHQKLLNEKLWVLRNNGPNPNEQASPYSPRKFQDKLLNSERIRRGIYPDSAYHNQPQQFSPSPQRVYPYPPQFYAYPHLPYLQGSYMPYNNSPSQHNTNARISSSQHELISTFEKQTRILENISKAVKDESNTEKNRHMIRNEFEERFSQLEKGIEYKLRLMRQEAALSQMNQNKKDQAQRSQNHAFPFNDTNVLLAPKKNPPPPEFKDYMIEFQGYLLSSLAAQQNYMHNQYSPFMFGNYNPNTNSDYGNEYTQSSHRSKKKKHKRNKTDHQMQSSRDSSKTKDQQAKPSTSSKPDSKKKPTLKPLNPDARAPASRNTSGIPQRRPLVLEPRDTGRRGAPTKDSVDIAAIALKNLRKILWTSVYPRILKTDVSNKVKERKKGLMQKFVWLGETAEKNLAIWLLGIVEKPVRGFINEKNKNYDFIGSPTTGFPSLSDTKSRVKAVMNLVRTILETLSKNINSAPIERNDLEFLASATLGERYALNNTLSNYELMRLKFNSYGRYMEVTQEQSYMILTCLLIVRLLVFELLISAKRWNDTVEWTEQLQYNVKIIASVIYQIALSILDENLEIINPKPSTLNITPMPPLRFGNDNNTVLSPDDPEMIIDLLTKEQLRNVFEVNGWVEAAKRFMRSSIDAVYNRVIGYRRENPFQNV